MYVLVSYIHNGVHSATQDKPLLSVAASLSLVRFHDGNWEPSKERTHSLVIRRFRLDFGGVEVVDVGEVGSLFTIKEVEVVVGID